MVLKIIHTIIQITINEETVEGDILLSKMQNANNLFTNDALNI